MERNRPRNDNELICSYKSGDNSAFRELYNRYRSQVDFVIKQFIQDKQLLKDYSQDVWLKVITHLDAFMEGNFNLWIRRIANNYCIDKFRKNKRHRFVDLNADMGSLVEDEVYDNETEKRLEQVFQSLHVLTTLQKKTILLRMRGLSFKSISKLNKIPKNTCQSSLPTAIVKIRKQLIKDGVFLKSNISLNLRKYK